MRIRTLQDAEKALHQYIDAVKKTGDNQSLERMWPLLEAVGNPHKKLNVIHVAGTSGKTSTSYYIAALLKSSGLSVGLTVSPHIDSITERLQIDGSPISDKEFCAKLEAFLNLVDGVCEPSYFELLIVFVLWVFALEKVDYVVLETGMGGLYDGTNVVSRADKVCVITRIGYDHMHILGNDITSIATQKAGIIHPVNRVFSQLQDPEAKEVIVKKAQEVDSLVEFVDDMKHSAGNDLPLFQRANWSVAVEAISYVAKRDGFGLQLLTPASIVIPGRMESFLRPDGSYVVMDGAHNQQKMKAFVESFVARFPDQKATVMLAMKEGKELDEVLNELKPITDKIIATEFLGYQDVPFKAQKAEVIKVSALRQGIQATTATDNQDALKRLLKNKGAKIITGSFYLLGQIRSKLK